MESSYYSQTAAAEIIGVSRKTLYRWQKKGTLVPTKIKNNATSFLGYDKALCMLGLELNPEAITVTQFSEQRGISKRTIYWKIRKANIQPLISFQTRVFYRLTDLENCTSWLVNHGYKKEETANKFHPAVALDEITRKFRITSETVLLMIEHGFKPFKKNGKMYFTQEQVGVIKKWKEGREVFQVAKEINVSVSDIFEYIEDNHCLDVSKAPNGVYYFDEQQFARVYNAFKEKKKVKEPKKSIERIYQNALCLSELSELTGISQNDLLKNLKPISYYSSVVDDELYSKDNIELFTDVYHELMLPDENFDEDDWD